MPHVRHSGLSSIPCSSEMYVVTCHVCSVPLLRTRRHRPLCTSSPAYRMAAVADRRAAQLTASAAHLREQIEHVALLLPNKKVLWDRQRLRPGRWALSSSRHNAEQRTAVRWMKDVHSAKLRVALLVQNAFYTARRIKQIAHCRNNAPGHLRSSS